MDPLPPPVAPAVETVQPLVQQQQQQQQLMGIGQPQVSQQVPPPENNGQPLAPGSEGAPPPLQPQQQVSQPPPAAQGEVAQQVEGVAQARDGQAEDEVEIEDRYTQ